ncbi:hypothetical protein [Nocardioides sp. CER19]|uniref:hypothetical protein n=1 Tax=Nocardioides sp. CER19 TaxID=3038538 RepID=UPI002449F629|nr:hypothetical protein [Nocardioides sp. CER19]MDH2414889.1 hypothetical protein [Nocardioides sp. CER19]
MSTPFNTRMLRAADAPAWAVCLVTGIALTTTAIVAEHKHAAADEARATTTEAPRGPATVAPQHPALPVSRSVSGGSDRRTLARSGALAATHQPKRAARWRPRVRRPHLPAPRRPRFPMARSNAAQIVAKAMHSVSNVPGMCLVWSRHQAGIPSKYSDAATAWRHATGRRPRDPNPPRGAAVYWTGGSHGFGHIAISVGHGKVRSSDAGGQGDVATVPIHHLSREWDLHYAGWANSINGYRIRGITALTHPA